MYAGEAERQLSALAHTNQALANEQYNRKMQALQQAEFFTKIGDERRGGAIKDATRSGIVGMGANFIDALQGNNGNPNVQTTSQLSGVQIPVQENIVTDKQSRADLKSKKEYERKVQKDPALGFINYAKDKGIVIPTEFTGDKAEQRKQNYDLHNAQIEYFMSNGMRDKARKAENEWIQNEINIDKSWGDKGEGNYKSLWNTSGPAGEKYEDIGIEAQYAENGAFMPAKNYRVPSRIIKKGRPAITKYINEQEGSLANGGSPIRNLNVVKAVSGTSELTPAQLEFNKGIENKAWANADTLKIAGSEIETTVIDGKKVFRRKGQGNFSTNVADIMK